MRILFDHNIPVFSTVLGRPLCYDSQSLPGTGFPTVSFLGKPRAGYGIKVQSNERPSGVLNTT